MKDADGNPKTKKAIGQTACSSIRFQLGDMLYVEVPKGDDPKYADARKVASFTGSPVVHNAMITEVPPEGTPQTGDNVFLVEAMKGNIRQVVKTPFHQLMERYPFGGVSVRRVNMARYPTFNKQAEAKWAESLVGQPFDTAMVNPLTGNVLGTHGRAIPKNPWCGDMTRAVKMYQSQDHGPGQWICSQLLAWGAAFAGGLNMGPGGPSGCAGAPHKFVVTDLNPYPGNLLDVPWVDPDFKFRADCDASGCWIGASTATTTTTTTITTTKKPAKSDDSKHKSESRSAPTPAPTPEPTAAPAPTPVPASTQSSESHSDAPAPAKKSNDKKDK